VQEGLQYLASGQTIKPDTCFPGTFGVLVQIPYLTIQVDGGEGGTQRSPHEETYCLSEDDIADAKEVVPPGERQGPFEVFKVDETKSGRSRGPDPMQFSFSGILPVEENSIESVLSGEIDQALGLLEATIAIHITEEGGSVDFYGRDERFGGPAATCIPSFRECRQHM
jgi:hypothetical protein